MRRATVARRAVASAAALLLILVVTAACSRRGPQGEGATLPPATELLSAAAAELRSVQTVRFEIDTTGSGDMLGITGADGVVTRDGEAEGARGSPGDGDAAEAAFVVKGDTAYVRAGAGDRRQVPLAMAAAVYDPTALLDPERGLAHLLATTSDARTEARDPGMSAYRVRATFDTRALNTLVPGANEEDHRDDLGGGGAAAAAAD